MEPAEILPALNYHFENDGTGLYDPGTMEVNVPRLSTFIARIWEVHPFREGNTRTVAVFSQLLLQNLGIPASNEVFKENGRWYRDALVRASYNSIREGIDADQSYLELFYGCMVSGTVLEQCHSDW